MDENSFKLSKKLQRHFPLLYLITLLICILLIIGLASLNYNLKEQTKVMKTMTRPYIAVTDVRLGMVFSEYDTLCVIYATLQNKGKSPARNIYATSKLTGSGKSGLKKSKNMSETMEGAKIFW